MSSLYYQINSKVSLFASLIVVAIIVLTLLYNKFKSEHYDDIGYGHYCDPKSCKEKTMTECLKCHNCSYIGKRGFNSQCVPGHLTPDDKKNNYHTIYGNDDLTRSNITVNEIYDNNAYPLFDD